MAAALVRGLSRAGALTPRLAEHALRRAGGSQTGLLARTLCSAAQQQQQQGIIITDACAKRIVQLNQKKGVSSELHKLLRLSVEPGGCSGFSYTFNLEESSAVEEDDEVFERAGARVVVDESSLQLLLGATVDYEEEMMKSAFVIKDNPIAEASCGCGTSFQVNI